MTNDQIKQDRSLEKIAMNIVYQIGDVLEASVDKRQATNDKAIEFVQGLLVDLERVTRQEERERIEALIANEKFSDPCGRDMIDSAYQDGWNDCIKLILNQDDND